MSKQQHIIQVYVTLINKGLKKIGEVPEEIRAEVKKALK